MSAWWEGLTTVSKVYYCIAIAATVILAIQVVMTLIGVGDSDADTDVEIDGDLDLFSIRGIIAFFAVGGWTGVVCDVNNAQLWVTIVASTAAGLASMFVVAYIIKLFTKLQSNGNIDMQYAVGSTAKVYIPISKETAGKITMTLQDRFMEFDAVTKQPESYVVGEIVKIVDLIGDTVVVEKLNSDN